MGFNGEGNGTPLQYSCLENPMDGPLDFFPLLIFSGVIVVLCVCVFF